MSIDESGLRKVSLTYLRDDISSCQHCSIVQEAKKPTPFRSPLKQCDQVWVGRNPGITERDQGEPFVGRTKKVMDDMITALGLTRDDIHITNVVKCYTCDPRPDRPPSKEEVQVCGDRFLAKELKLVKPKIVVTWGKDAVVYVSNGRISSCRFHSGRSYRFDGLDYVIFPMEHPGVLIRNAMIGQESIQQVMERDFANLYLTLKQMEII